MNSNPSPTLNDLIEINQEIAALIRAGVPLELGLRSIAGGVQTSFDRLADRMANRLGRGQSLSDAFASETASLSPVYAAVVEAGLKAGQLPDALDSVARSAKITQDIRQQLGLAMVYPLMCLGLAFPLAAFVISGFVPRLRSTMEDYHLPVGWSIRTAYMLYENLSIWFVQIPTLILVLAVVIYLLRFGPTRLIWRSITSLNWLPGFGRIQRSLRQTQFVELVALQTSFGIPLETAFPQAAAVTEDTRLRKDAENIASALRSGKSLRDALAGASTIPASWKWVLVTSAQGDMLPTAIRQLADTCRYKATRQAAWFNYVVPTTLALCCSTAIVIVYALIILLPVISLWSGLSQP